LINQWEHNFRARNSSQNSMDPSSDSIGVTTNAAAISIHAAEIVEITGTGERTRS
jgi:hypothetical protein